MYGTYSPSAAGFTVGGQPALPTSFQPYEVATSGNDVFVSGSVPLNLTTTSYIVNEYGPQGTTLLQTFTKPTAHTPGGGGLAIANGLLYSDYINLTTFEQGYDIFNVTSGAFVMSVQVAPPASTLRIRSLAIDASGNVYVDLAYLDGQGTQGAVQEVSAAGTSVRTLAGLSNPTTVLIDPAGDLVVLEHISNFAGADGQLAEYPAASLPPAGGPSAYLLSEQLGWQDSLTIDAAGRLFDIESYDYAGNFRVFPSLFGNPPPQNLAAPVIDFFSQIAVAPNG